MQVSSLSLKLPLFIYLMTINQKTKTKLNVEKEVAHIQDLREDHHGEQAHVGEREAPPCSIC